MSNKIKPGMMKYCVVGNIVAEHTDENGVIRYGTAAFPSGRKVYISRRLWGDAVTVMGLNRFKSKYVLTRIPLALMENIRPAKTYSPRVTELMTNTAEYADMWWENTAEDKQGSVEYAQLLNRVKGGDRAAFERYERDVMQQFY